MAAEARDVERDPIGGHVDTLGPGEVGSGGLGSLAPSDPGDLAGGAASLLGRPGVVVRRRRHAEDRQERDEDDHRPAREKQSPEGPEALRFHRHRR